MDIRIVWFISCIILGVEIFLAYQFLFSDCSFCLNTDLTLDNVKKELHFYKRMNETENVDAEGKVIKTPGFKATSLSGKRCKCPYSITWENVESCKLHCMEDDDCKFIQTGTWKWRDVCSMFSYEYNSQCSGTVNKPAFYESSRKKECAIGKNISGKENPKEEEEGYMTLDRAIGPILGQAVRNTFAITLTSEKELSSREGGKDGVKYKKSYNKPKTETFVKLSAINESFTDDVVDVNKITEYFTEPDIVLSSDKYKELIS